MSGKSEKKFPSKRIEIPQFYGRTSSIADQQEALNQRYKQLPDFLKSMLNDSFNLLTTIIFALRFLVLPNGIVRDKENFQIVKIQFERCCTAFKNCIAGIVLDFPLAYKALYNVDQAAFAVRIAVIAAERDAQSAVKCRKRPGDEDKRQVSVGESSQRKKQAVYVAPATVRRSQPMLNDKKSWEKMINDIKENVTAQLYKFGGKETEGKKTRRKNGETPVLHLICHKCKKNFKFARFRKDRGKFGVVSGKGKFTKHFYDSHVPPKFQKAYGFEQLKDELEVCFKNYIEHFNNKMEIDSQPVEDVDTNSYLNLNNWQ